MYTTKSLTADQQHLTDITYNAAIGLYCRFGDKDVHAFEPKWYGGIYVWHPNNNDGFSTQYHARLTGEFIRTPVAFEVAPGMHIKLDSLALEMGLPATLIYDSYTQMLRPVYATLDSRWNYEP